MSPNRINRRILALRKLSSLLASEEILDEILVKGEISISVYYVVLGPQASNDSHR